MIMPNESNMESEHQDEFLELLDELEANLKKCVWDAALQLGKKIEERQRAVEDSGQRDAGLE